MVQLPATLLKTLLPYKPGHSLTSSRRALLAEYHLKTKGDWASAVPQLWNSLPEEQKSFKSHLYKKKEKTFYL